MQQRTALILGASGLTGGHCLEILLHDPTYSHVSILVRRRMDIEHPKLEQHMVDFELLQYSAPLLKADDVFCCLGTTIKTAGSQEAFKRVDYEYPLNAAQLAFKNGVQNFLLVSSNGADAASKIFYSRTKGELESALKKIGFKSLSIFRPSLLIGKRSEGRFGEKLGEIIGWLLKPLLIGPLKKFRPIEARLVACAMVNVAKSGLKGTHIFESDEIQTIGQR
ncbi:MAG TPA: oxidoreductase [Patescibacteria group bacterium]|nr:oxidoreductase [Patescibacteria group bacterium]